MTEANADQGFADHFSTVARAYAAYRPRYPVALTDALAERCTRRDVAWDAGCGNGQLSTELASRFARVIATDPSRTQIEAAELRANIEYRIAKAEASGVPDASVDLAVAAQAAHWFDWPRYVAEVARVTRPGALVALICYGNMRVDSEAQQIVRTYYAGDADPFWPPERVHIENGYRDLVLPWPAVDAPAIDLIARWTRDELVGYLTTWSATQGLVKARGPAPFDAVTARLATAWPDNEPREIRWPLTIKLARV